jgi:signal transduction histidine kinase
LAQDDVELIRQQREALAAHLHASRERIVLAWRERVAHDPTLTTAFAISLVQFTDNVPRVLDAFEQAVRADSAHREAQAEVQQREGASEHGLQRWQQGYDLRETVREWGHLQACLMSELEDYAAAHPQLHALLLRRTREALVNLCGEGACESAARYARLQQAEAAGRINDLQLVADQLRALEKTRADFLRQAAHDLRGSVAVISNASAALARTDSEQVRVDSQRILDRSIKAARSLLTDLLELTRLEAGHDQVQISAFDASELLRNLGETMRPMATAGGLFLHLDGPRSLPVNGDPVKVQRIAQNLMLNAIGATTAGGITVSWRQPVNDGRWSLAIADTGPGLVGAHATPLTDAMAEPADGGPALKTAAGRAAARSVPRPGPSSAAGEGIGLSIVKRLCELLGAGIEVESKPGAGTEFRLSFPADMAASRALPAPPDAAPDPP